MKDLFHFSDEPLPRIELRVQPRASIKPIGLWVSDEADFGWSTWCREEKFHLERLAIRHRIRLASESGVLAIGTIETFDAFAARYAVPLGRRATVIDWAAVADRHRGILITPYRWDRRLSSFWYCGWDCASGCIWDPAAIAAIDAPFSELPAGDGGKGADSSAPVACPLRGVSSLDSGRLRFGAAAPFSGGRA